MTIDINILTVIADSLALVRPEDGITEKDIYSFKIQAALCGKVYVNSKAVQNNSSLIENSLTGLVYHIQAASASYAIIGLGIVDCSPRLFTKKMKLFLECATQIPVLKKIVHKYISYMSNNRLKYTQRKQITETSLEEYRKNIREIINNIKLYNPIEKIFLLTIAFPGPYLTNRSWGIKENIQKFNAALYEIASENPSLIEIIDIYTFTRENPSYILADGHHVSIEVHDYIAQSVVQTIESLTS